MRRFKFQNLLFLFFLILAFSLQNPAQSKIICNETSERGSTGSTFFLWDGLKLKNIKGKAVYPDLSPAGEVYIEIYRNILKRNSKIGFNEVQQITSSENEIKICQSDEKGNFEIKSLEDGFYLLKIGLGRNEGFGPVYVLVEISRKKGEKRNLEIELLQAV
jgi:hypothetical protein